MVKKDTHDKGITKKYSVYSELCEKHDTAYKTEFSINYRW